MRTRVVFAVARHFEIVIVPIALHNCPVDVGEHA